MIEHILARAVRSGAFGTISSAVALALVARAEGNGAAQPLNATSHWLNGDRAARRPQIDLQHTGVGIGTHFAATAFWATAFEAWMGARPTRRLGEVAGCAAAVSALAAVIDYTITPKRFTPGWELVLTKASMAVVYAAMAAGFVASTRRA